MKLLLGTLLIFSLMILGYFIYRAYRTRHTLAQTVGRIFLFGFIIMLSNLFTLFAWSETVCSFGYSIYFISIDWMLYFLLHFSLEYIGNRFENHVKKIPMLLLLGTDSVSILCNIFTKHLYQLKPVLLFDNERYHELHTLPLFYTHHGIVLMLVTFCLISLLYKAFTAPLFYRGKYLSIAIVTILAVFLNIYSFSSAIDLSIIGYVIVAAVIYYCTFVFTPQKLLPKTWALVARDMDIGLYIMDAEGHSLYSNPMAAQFLSSTNPLVNGDGLSLKEWCRSKYRTSAEEFTTEETFLLQGRERILKIQMLRITDTRRLLQGGYFILHDRTDEVLQLQQDFWLSTHDSLTGLYNKEYFCEKASQYIHSHPDEELLMLCTDFKDFKLINDFLGTCFGDTLLVNFSNILKEQMTRALITGRLVNDVFAILIRKADYCEATFTREKQQDFFSGREEKVSFPIINYIGIYEITDRTLPVTVMCDRARLAITTIKGNYNKRVAYYDDAIRDRILHEQELISSLQDAIKNHELQMYLQPQTAADGTLLGAEALVRWLHPQKGMISPAYFIPVFEKNGLISDVDLYMWEEACSQLSQWKKEGLEHLYISVNISPRDFYFLDIYKELTGLIKKYNISSHSLKLEITETAISLDFKRQLELIKALRQEGFTVEMDDFGSGYSSLNMLKDLPVDILKIDMAFLKKSSDEARSKKILKMIIELSAELDMGVITEGVEEAEQVRFLSDMGCRMFQGYYFAKPMSIHDFKEKYL